MLIKHLDKIYTFLLVVKEESFSKASKILNISQPAVTQQIKILEDFLGTKLFERKKRKFTLTKRGEEFFKLAKEFNDFLEKFERKINKFQKIELPLLIGASPTIGNYNLPECIKYYKTLLNKEINLIIKDNDSLLEDVKNGLIDLAFVTKKKNNGLHYVEWIEDELVVFSNKPLPPVIEIEDLKKYKLICRENTSSIREFLQKTFNEFNFSCNTLNILSVVHDSTALKYTVMNEKEQVVSIISKVVIKNEVRNKKLFMAKIKGINLKRKSYMVYKEKTRDIEIIEKFIRS